MLPADFTKQDAVKQAEVLGVNVRTMEDWLEKAIQQIVIERIMKGRYTNESLKYNDRKHRKSRISRIHHVRDLRKIRDFTVKHIKPLFF